MFLVYPLLRFPSSRVWTPAAKTYAKTIPLHHHLSYHYLEPSAKEFTTWLRSLRSSQLLVFRQIKPLIFWASFLSLESLFLCQSLIWFLPLSFKTQRLKIGYFTQIANFFDAFLQDPKVWGLGQLFLCDLLFWLRGGLLLKRRKLQLLDSESENEPEKTAEHVEFFAIESHLSFIPTTVQHQWLNALNEHFCHTRALRGVNVALQKPKPKYLPSPMRRGPDRC